MPYYNYICTSCKHEWEEFGKISSMDVPLSLPCPECQTQGKIEKRIYGAPLLGDSVKMGITKPDSDFRDLMRNIHKKTPGSELDKTSTLCKI